MISEHYFWQIIDASLENSTQVGSIEQDNILIQTLEGKTIDELTGFQLRLLRLRAGLEIKHVYSIAQQLGYTKLSDVFNRFKNGIIASGKAFYYHAKDKPDFLETFLKNNPQLLKQCYYEGLSLVAPSVFYELTDYDASWDNALQKSKRELEIERKESNDIDNFLLY